MARRRNAAAPAAPVEEPEAQQQDAKGGQQQLRRRRGGAAAAPPAAAAAAEPAFVDPVDSMPRWEYYPRQYGGLLLGLLAVYCSLTCHKDRGDDTLGFKLLAWMFVALIALGIHELRPFKRMNYEDKAREQGWGYRHLLGLR